MDKNEFKRELENIFIKINGDEGFEFIDDGENYYEDKMSLIDENIDLDIQDIRFENSYFKHGIKENLISFSATKFIVEAEGDEETTQSFDEINRFVQQSYSVYAKVSKDKLLDVHLSRITELEKMVICTKERRTEIIMKFVNNHEKYLVDECLNDSYTQCINEVFNRIRLFLSDFIDVAFNEFLNEVGNTLRHDYDVIKKLF